MKTGIFKKISISLIIIAIGIIVSISVIGSRSGDKSGSVVSASDNTSEADLSLDRDRDALLDWEELLWGTDPNNPDTDGDGTPDGEEVKSDRDPLVAGPDDNLSEEETSGTTKPIRPNTPTAKVGASLLSQFMTAQRQGGTLSEADIQKIAEGSIEEVAAYDKNFSRSDVLIFDPTSTAQIKTYLNSVSSAFLSDTGLPQENEMSVFLAMADEGTEALADMKIHADKYFGVSEKLLDIAVPKAFSNSHLALVQATYNTGEDLERLSSVDSIDPMVFLISMQAYGDNSSQINALLNQFFNYANQSNLSFSTDDPFTRLRVIIKGR